MRFLEACCNCHCRLNVHQKAVRNVFIFTDTASGPRHIGTPTYAYLSAVAFSIRLVLETFPGSPRKTRNLYLYASPQKYAGLVSLSIVFAYNSRMSSHPAFTLCPPTNSSFRFRAERASANQEQQEFVLSPARRTSHTLVFEELLSLWPI